MRRKIIKSLITIWLILIFVGMFVLVNRIMIPKYFMSASFPVSASTSGFYELEPYSCDVIFIGSSHGATFFDPKILKDDYEINSYNLCTEMQNMVTSYYWLKEALEYQNPKVVVIDTLMAFPFLEDEILNSSEGTTRKAIDYMRLSQNKLEFIFTLHELDPEQYDIAGLIFPIIRYHEVWKELDEESFQTTKKLLEDYDLRGYVRLENADDKGDYYPFSQEIDAGVTMQPLMKEYLDKIIELCKSKGIGVITVQVPSAIDNAAKYYVSEQYAKEHGTVNIDFNYETIYRGIGYNYEYDNADNSHGNVDGAAKVTAFLGDVLKLQFGL